MTNRIKFRLFLGSLAHKIGQISTERNSAGEVVVGVIFRTIRVSRKLQCIQGAMRKPRMRQCDSRA